MQDHYDTLGVGREATTWEIKAAYRQLVRRLHPDTNAGGQGGATDRLLEVQQAYEVLSHPGRRASYDAGISNGVDQILSNGGVADALEGLFDSVLGDAPAPAPEAAPAEDAPPRSDPTLRPGEEDVEAAPPTKERHPGLTASLVGATLVTGTLGYWLLASALPTLTAGSLTEFFTLLLVVVLVAVLALLGSWSLSYVDRSVATKLRRGADRVRAFRRARTLPWVEATGREMNRVLEPFRVPPPEVPARGVEHVERWVDQLSGWVGTVGPGRRGRASTDSRPTGARPPDDGPALLLTTGLLALLFLAVAGIANALVVAGSGPGWLDRWQGPAVVGLIAAVAGAVFAALERDRSGSSLRPVFMTVNVATVAGAAVSGYLAWYRSDVADFLAETFPRLFGYLLAGAARVLAGVLGLVVVALFVYLGMVAWHHLAELATRAMGGGRGRAAAPEAADEAAAAVEEGAEDAEEPDARAILAFLLDFALFVAWAGAFAGVARGLGAAPGTAPGGVVALPGLPFLLPLGIALGGFATGRLVERVQGAALLMGGLLTCVPLVAGGVWAILLLKAVGIGFLPSLFAVGLLAASSMELDGALGAAIRGVVTGVAAARAGTARVVSVLLATVIVTLVALAGMLRGLSAPGGRVRALLGGGSI